MLKKLFYASASILMLALAYHLGAQNATAQAGSTIVGVTGGGPGLIVVTLNGDVYAREVRASSSTPCSPSLGCGPLLMGNLWSGGPTPAAQPTFGQVKAQYRK